MRKLAILAAAISVASAATPAQASSQHCSDTCELILMPLALAVGGGMVAAYGYGTGYYVKNDLEGDPQPLSYYGTELILHGSLATAFTGAAIDAARNGSVGATIGTGAFAALHLTLATNGLRGTWSHRDEIGKPSATVVKWSLGTIYSLNTLYWAGGWPHRHGRGYAIAEISINAPIVIGLGLMARDGFAEQRGTGPLYGGMAAISALYVAHGVKRLAFPRRTKLDLLGTDLMPTVVSDGIELAPGFGTAGSF